MKLGDWLSGAVFRTVHGHNLVYNACWEDPRLDRIALELGPEDTVVVITSAGCNALDYVLDEPRHVHAVDVNPRQNALLELKLAGIRALDHESFFALFGRGALPDFPDVYRKLLREQLSAPAQEYWDRHLHFFAPRPRSSFYFHGTAGRFARLINFYVDRIARVRPGIEALLDAHTVEEQREIYADMQSDFWRRSLRWFLGRDAALAMLGVPRAQRLQVERNYNGGIAQFMEDCVEAVFTRLPTADNYFYHVYLRGHYSSACCPAYLEPDNFARLKDGLVDRITPHTNTVEGFLREHDGPISRFVLLDHMDWLASASHEALVSEWQAIVDRATPDARALWRSGGLNVDYVDPIEVRVNNTPVQLGELLRYNRTLATDLHPLDRVHTYGSFYIADLVTG